MFSEGIAGFTRQVNRFSVKVLGLETVKVWPSPTSAEGGEKPLPSGSGEVTEFSPS